MSERPSEFELIARYFAPLAGEGGFDLLDDAGIVVTPPGCDLVVTKDMLVAGVHFFADDPADLIARKALRVNLSDLAAKGARPTGFLLGLALPGDWQPGWLASFAAGLGDDSRDFGCPLLGGDTVKTPGPLTVSITAFGQVPAGGMVRRTAARPGDALVVTGTIGDAALGLRARLDPPGSWRENLREQARNHLEGRYLLPQPRLALAEAVQRHARAAMDISDGFVGDLTKMILGAGAGAAVNLAAVSLSQAAHAAILLEPALYEAALTGGDDYELLLALPPQELAPFLAEARRLGQQAGPIGTVVESGPVVFLEADGTPREFAQGSFVHF